MYRPRLISRVTGWLAPHPPTPIAPHALQEQVGRAFVGDSDALCYLTVMVSTYAYERIAFHAARRLIDDAGTPDRDFEVAVSGRVEHPLPDSPVPGDGGIVTWRTRPGDIFWATAVVRLGQGVWEFTANGTEPGDVVRVVRSLARTSIRRWQANPALDHTVEKLLPAAIDLPVSMRLDAEITPLIDNPALAA